MPLGKPSVVVTFERTNFPSMAYMLQGTENRLLSSSVYEPFISVVPLKVFSISSLSTKNCKALE